MHAIVEVWQAKGLGNSVANSNIILDVFNDIGNVLQPDQT